jgi:hypothetical protein
MFFHRFPSLLEPRFGAPRYMRSDFCHEDGGSMFNRNVSKTASTLHVITTSNAVRTSNLTSLCAFTCDMFRIDCFGVSAVTFVCRWRYVVRIGFAFALCSALPGIQNCRGGGYRSQDPVTRPTPLAPCRWAQSQPPLETNSMLYAVRQGFMRYRCRSGVEQHHTVWGLSNRQDAYRRLLPTEKRG